MSSGASLVLALVVGLLLVVGGGWRFVVRRGGQGRRPRFDALVGLLVGALLLTFVGLDFVGAQGAGQEVTVRFEVSVPGEKGQVPQALFLYSASDLTNSHRVPWERGPGGYTLVPGQAYIVNASKQGTPEEWAATEDPRWRHFHLVLLIRGNRVDLNETARYVKDGIPENADGRFLLFTL